RPPPSSTLFPYTTLFRSRKELVGVLHRDVVGLPSHADVLVAATWIALGQNLHLAPGVSNRDDAPPRVRLERAAVGRRPFDDERRSEEHTSELQSRSDLVC